MGYIDNVFNGGKKESKFEKLFFPSFVPIKVNVTGIKEIISEKGNFLSFRYKVLEGENANKSDSILIPLRYKDVISFNMRTFIKAFMYDKILKVIEDAEAAGANERAITDKVIAAVFENLNGIEGSDCKLVFDDVKDIKKADGTMMKVQNLRSIEKLSEEKTEDVEF